MPGLELSPETRLALLLCGSLARPRDAGPSPLSTPEYRRVLDWRERHGLAAEGLLAWRGGPGWPAEDLDGIDPARLAALLDREGALIAALERWVRHGLWALGRADPGYPPRLLSRLGKGAPPVVYGAGKQELLSSGGLVIVGSRAADAAGLAFARRAALACVALGIPVISGGAVGVDGEAMAAALRERGRVAAVLAHNLAGTAGSARYRDYVRAGALALVTPFDPDSQFSVGRAMGRNRVIHALGDWSLVVSAAAGQGGTWAGAREHLRRGVTPLLVRAGPQVPEGNRLLIELGAEALDPSMLDGPGPLRGVLFGSADGCPAERHTGDNPARSHGIDR